MTNNDNIKEDASVLLSKVLAFKRKYRVGGNNTPLAEFERELRLILMVARTDEENQAQSNADCLC